MRFSVGILQLNRGYSIFVYSLSGTRRDVMERKFLGVTFRRWIEYTVAILAGNAIYYFSLVPHLPQALRHQGFLLDWGSLTDFVVCLAVYGLLRLGAKL